MSVINQMLKDLDRRQQEAEGAAVYVAPVRQQGWWMLVLTLLCTLALGILGWRTWIFWQQSQRASLPAAQVEALRTAPAHADGLLCRASGKGARRQCRVDRHESGPLRSRAGSGR